MKINAAVLLISLLNVILCAAYARIIPKPLSPARNSLSIRAGELGVGSELSSLDWRYFAAGDVVKTRMQTDPERYTKGVIHAAREIVAEDGVGYLLAGLGPTVVGYGLEGALKFGFYETFKSVFCKATPYQFLNFLLASIVAGAVASIVLCPMEEARIKMVGDASWAHENVVSSIMRLIREDGLFSSFAGLPAMLSKQIPYTMGKQVSFDLLAQLLYAAVAHMAVSKNDAKLAISVGAAFLASVVACVMSQPGDMVLTATCKAPGGETGNGEKIATNSKDFSNIVSGIYRQRGLGGFFLGLQARLAHVASIITSQLVAYDLIKTALGLPVTGSH